MKVRKILATVPALSVALAGLIFTSPAHAVELDCGAFLGPAFANTTVTLTADVGPCSTGSGITIEEANGLTLDLNGHAVIGDGSVGVPFQNFTGITTYNASNVTIKNGTVTMWNNGIFLDGSGRGGGSNSTVTNMTVVDNIGPDAFGIFGEGIQVFQGSGHTIEDNEVIHNGPFGGIIAFQSGSNTITGNTVSDNNVLNTSGERGRANPNGGVGGASPDTPPAQMQDIGIWVVNGQPNPALAEGNVVSDNQVSGSGFDGIQVARFTDDTTVSGNQLADNGSAQPSGSSIPRDGAGIANFGTFNSMLGNSIQASAALGIDLGGDGVTPNDLGDPDPGANLLQNFPVLSSAATGASATSVAGSLNSYASTPFTLELFSSPACDPSGFGEGQTPLGTHDVTTDANGDVSFTADLPVGGLPGDQITATATGPNGTSEFSACLAATAAEDAAEIAVFRPDNGVWYVRGGPVVQFGTDGDIPVQGDYNGDGNDEIAVFRPSTGVWYFLGDGAVAFGTNGDIPVPADYDGDGDDDIAVFRPSNGAWYILGGPAGIFGTMGDIPVPADYDGDGDDDLAVFRPSTGTWYVNGGPSAQFGTTGDIPVPGDYDGDGSGEFAVYRPFFGTWFVDGLPAVQFGTMGDIPVPEDYDGDGTTDIAVFRPSAGAWFLEGGQAVSWGTNGDVPVPADYFG